MTLIKLKERVYNYPNYQLTDAQSKFLYLSHCLVRDMISHDINWTSPYFT
jgi:hypothetical protein